MGQTIYQVDAFTDRPFTGNPAAVCVLPGPADEAWMRNVALEMNLSETAFLHPQDEMYHLRWFRPTNEARLCGHATLASAHILWETHRAGLDEQIRFETQSGLLTAERRGDWIELDFPGTPTNLAPAPPEDLDKALGATPRSVSEPPGLNTYLVELDSPATVRDLKPDFALLHSISNRSYIVTALAESAEHDFVSRFFRAAGVGENEDPVTGAAHCLLGPYWRDRLGKDELVGHQVSARSGTVKVRVVEERVRLIGQAVTVMRAELI